MDCNRFKEDLLVAYLFDEATDDERKTVEEHLASCEACAGAFKELGGTVSTMQAWKDEELPRKVVLLPNRKERAGGRFRAPLWLKGLGWAAAAAIAVLVLSQGSIKYSEGSLTVSFGRDEVRELTAGMEEGRSPKSPAEVVLSNPDSISSTPRRTGPLPQEPPEAAFASLSDLERAQRENMAYFEQLIRASDQRRSEQWRQGIDYLLTMVNDQRQRDLNEIMGRIEAVGAGAMGGLQMTNIRLDELASTVAPVGYQGRRSPSQLTPEQIRRVQQNEEE